MSYWIAEVLRRERERAGVSTAAIGQILGAHEQTIKRFEEGESMTPDIDRRVAAYAYLLGVDDGRELWDEAMDAWWDEKTGGDPPVFAPAATPAAQYAEAIRQASLRQQAGAAAKARRRAATQRRRDRQRRRAR